jgi:hypothetical protein
LYVGCDTLEKLLLKSLHGFYFDDTIFCVELDPDSVLEWPWKKRRTRNQDRDNLSAENVVDISNYIRL